MVARLTLQRDAGTGSGTTLMSAGLNPSTENPYDKRV